MDVQNKTLKKAVMIHYHYDDPQDCTDYAVDEGKSLLDTYGAELVHKFIFNVHKISPATYINSGQAEKVKLYLDENPDIDFVFWNHIIGHRHHRVLEKTLNKSLLDRTKLILDIFRARASSSEEKLQVELAYKEYEKSRVVHAWNHLERQRGSLSNVGGPGEKQLELDRRIIDNKIKVYKKKLQSIAKSRATQRRSRAEVPLVAIVGYTNVGKTTLFNLLTRSRDLAEDKLFATLGPHVRRVFIDGTDPKRDRHVLFADTVGFIRNFPTSLRNAFAATLEEIKYADLILHIRDIRMPFEDRYSANVLQTLQDIGADEIPIWTVWNKWDREDHVPEVQPNTFHISALTGLGINNLKSEVMQYCTSLLPEFVK